MNDQPRIIAASNSPRVPLITWTLLVVVLIALGGFLAVAAGGTKTVLVPKKDIAAYKRVTAADFEEKSVRGRGLTDDAVAKAGDVEGHVTLEALGAGDPVSGSVLTAAAVTASQFQVPLLRLQASNKSHLGAKPGQLVDVHMAPTGDDHEQHAATVRALLVDVDEPEKGGAEYVVSVPGESIPQLLELAARAEIYITPDP